MKNDKNVEKIHERERLSEKNQWYIRINKSGENICHLRIPQEDCEIINVKESILSGILEYIYEFVCYILKIENIAEFNLYFTCTQT